MDRKTWMILGLVLLACVLGGVVTSGLRDANAQGGVYSTYVLQTAEVSDDYEQFVVLDTAARRLLFYQYDRTGNDLQRVQGLNLEQQFRPAGAGR